MTTAPPTARAATSPPRARRAPYRLVAYSLGVVMLGTTVPTPLYAIHQERLGLSNATITVVFAAYAAGVLVTSAAFGRTSDRHGRKPVLLAAVGSATASAAVFLATDGLAGLLVARLLSGLSVGLMLGTATATLIELQPRSARRRAELASTVANMAGLAVGPLASGLLAEYGPAPTELPYVLLVTLLAPTALLATIPETARRPGADAGDAAPAGHPPPARGPAGGGRYRAVLVAAGITAFTTFAVQGLLSSLAPTFLATELGERSHALSGAVAFALFACAALAQVAVPRLGPERGVRTGLAAVPVALGLLVAAVASASLAAFVVATVLVGLGSGLAFASALALLGTVGDGRNEAGLASTYFAFGFAGLTVPVIGAGMLVDRLSVVATTVVFASIVTVLAAASVAAIGAAGRHTAGPGGTAAPTKG